MIRENNYAEEMKAVVEPTLDAIFSEQWLETADGKLHVECYLPEKRRHMMLLLHGFTESAEKFREMIYYFTQEGIGVVALDQRGHGKSLRLVEDPSLVHVNRFHDYVDDAMLVVKQVINPIDPSPCYLYAHSMGGAVGGMLAMEMPECFDRVCLSSPMMAPSSGNTPMWIGQCIADVNGLIGRGSCMAFIGSAYDAEKDTFENGCDTSQARFEYYKRKRAARTELQTCSPSYRWVAEACRVKKVLLNPDMASRITAKLLLCQTGKDTVVLLPEQNAFVSHLRDGSLATFPEAKHEIYFSEDQTMEKYLETVLNFFE